jgi:ubiquinone/menaquinone biosynthesis C-methylase UbiE
MLDHFGLLSPFYDRVMRQPDPGPLLRRLGLPHAGALLEVGGGTGRVSSQLRPHIGRLVICDLSSRMLGQARSKGDARLVQSRAETLPFPEGSFDRILVVDALHHFADQPAAMRELARVLAPGGRLVIQEPDIRRLPVKLIALAETLALMNSHFFQPEEIRGMAGDANLEAWAEADGLAAWIVAQKPA